LKSESKTILPRHSGDPSKWCKAAAAGGNSYTAEMFIVGKKTQDKKEAYPMGYASFFDKKTLVL
jgi:hypothetical protein